MSGLGNGQTEFPKLPILGSVAVPPPRKERDKYGGLYYLGIGGLVLLVVMVGWFGYRVWQLRGVWAKIYALHDANRSDEERVESAVSLSHDPRVTDRQLMEICLRRDLPERARYVLAEAVSTEAVAADPRAFALTVALSQDWPDWLRLVLAPAGIRGGPRLCDSRSGARRAGEALRSDDPYLGELLAGDFAGREIQRRGEARGSGQDARRQRQTRGDAAGGEGFAGSRA